ncbi:MAG: HEAT repeat domain-containing protein [Verrucomicrobiota bacterium]|nr:HEAT repeat domain-containing protein [Verrucomicrobiota bacterium]
MLDQALEALKTYEWGVDPKAVKSIQDAVVASHGDAAARKKLESTLAKVLGTDIPRAAKDIVCRALKTIGTAHSVPALAKLLHDEELSHMARHALETNDAPEAVKALVGAIDKAPKKIKIGIISSLGAREFGVPVAPLAKALSDKDADISTAGALALGAIGSADAVKALGSAKVNDTNKIAVCDAMLQCAENMLAHGKKSGAKAIYGTVLKIGPTEAAKIAADLGIKASA